MKPQLGWGASLAIAIGLLAALAIVLVAWSVLSCSTYTYCGGPL